MVEYEYGLLWYVGHGTPYNEIIENLNQCLLQVPYIRIHIRLTIEVLIFLDSTTECASETQVLTFEITSAIYPYFTVIYYSYFITPCYVFVVCLSRLFFCNLYELYYTRARILDHQ